MMTPDQWRRYLQECSDELLKEPLDSNGPNFSETIRQSRWLGYDTASIQAIEATEQRLGIPLPPSLRAFYRVTNGWRIVGYSIWEVLPVERIGWLEDVDPGLWELAKSTEQSDPASWGASHAEEFADYILEQGTRVACSLVVSGNADSSTWLLDGFVAQRVGYQIYRVTPRTVVAGTV